MNTIRMTSTAVAARILNPGTGVRRAAGVAVREAANPWPWPLPADSVLAVFDRGVTVLDVMGVLTDAGVTSRDVWMAPGEGGARRLREAYAGRGLLSRLASIINDEHEVVAGLEALSAGGATVMLVHAPAGRTDEVAAAVARHGARILRRTGRWVATGNAIAAPVGQPRDRWGVPAAEAAHA